MEISCVCIFKVSSRCCYDLFDGPSRVCVSGVIDFRMLNHAWIVGETVRFLTHVDQFRLRLCFEFLYLYGFLIHEVICVMADKG